MLAGRQSRGRLKKDSELSKGVTLNLEPLTLISPPNSKWVLKGGDYSGWISVNVFLLVGGHLIKGGRDYSYYYYYYDDDDDDDYYYYY